MGELEIFKNEEFGEIRSLEIEGKIYFVGNDIAKILGYSRPNEAISRHCKGTLKQSIPTNGGNQDMLIIPEGDIYRLIVSSKLPNAEKFELWVFDDVLPTIRKHGAYMTEDTLEKALTSPDFLIQLATKLKEEQEKNKKLNEEIKENKPKVTFADRVIKSKDNVTVTILSKMISDEGFTISNQKLYNVLRNWGYIYKRSRLPIQKYVEKGYFVTDTYAIDTVYGVKEQHNVKITPDGQIHIVERILKENRMNN